jgi:formylglycine-generating enzyme
MKFCIIFENLKLYNDMKVRALLASVLFLFILILGACSKKGINESGGASTTTGWEYNNTENGGFEVVQKYEPETGPGLVFV